MALTVKAYLLGRKGSHKEIRRFTLDGEEAAFMSCFNALNFTVSQMFPSLRHGAYRMHYKDGDGDLITFSSDNEMRVGLKYVKDNTIHVFIKDYKDEEDVCE